MSARENSIGFLRFWLAAQVLVSHAWPLGGFGLDPLMRYSHSRQSLGQFAVAGFFAISGLLIAESFARLNSLPRFLWHRLLRIFPGFWVCLLVTVFAFAPYQYYREHSSLVGYWSTTVDSPTHYLVNNGLLHMWQWSVAGLLKQVPYKDAFDGSLWSLIYEFRFYLCTGLMGLLGLLGTRKKLGGVLALTTIIVCIALFDTGHAAELGSYYAAGTAWYAFRQYVPMRSDLAIGTVLTMALTMRFGGWFIAGPFCMVYLLMFLAQRLPFRRFDARGDFSYGFYIYAFPIQQLLAGFNVHKQGIVPYILWSAALTMPLAVASYLLIEKPFLRMKNFSMRRTAPAR